MVLGPQLHQSIHNLLPPNIWVTLCQLCHQGIEAAHGAKVLGNTGSLCRGQVTDRLFVLDAGAKTWLSCQLKTEEEQKLNEVENIKNIWLFSINIEGSQAYLKDGHILKKCCLLVTGRFQCCLWLSKKILLSIAPLNSCERIKCFCRSRTSMKTTSHLSFSAAAVALQGLWFGCILWGLRPSDGGGSLTLAPTNSSVHVLHMWRMALYIGAVQLSPCTLCRLGSTCHRKPSKWDNQPLHRP